MSDNLKAFFERKNDAEVEGTEHILELQGLLGSLGIKGIQNSPCTGDVKLWVFCLSGDGAELATRSAETAREAASAQSSGHRRLLLSQLAELRHDSQLCDVTLVAKETRINAHRVVLAASSSYFKAMFTHEMVESRLNRVVTLFINPFLTEEVEIKDMEASTLDAVVSFCYSGSITISLVNVLNILPASCLLQLNEVQEYCCEFLKKELHPLNCLGISAFADTYACRELLRFSYQYILDHFQEVVDTEEFLLLPAEQLIELVSNEELRVISEEEVFKAVIQWVRFDLTARKRFLPQLLEQVRLPLCYPKFLVDVVSKVDLVVEDINCRRLLEEAKNYQLLQLSTPVRPDMQGLRTRPRNPIKYSDVLFVVGGLCNDAALDSVERLDPGEPNPSWQPVASMSKKRDKPAVAVFNNVLYAVGGVYEGEILNSIERYDPVTNQWSSDVAPMLARREDFGLAALDGFLYAVGGFDGWECLDSVERYDIRRNEWIRVAPLGSCRGELSVSVLNGCLYAVGGSDGDTCINVVERLDPRVGKWQVVRPMSTPRSSPGTAVLDGNLYAAGGFDSSLWLWLGSVEKYDSLTNKWTTVAAINCSTSAIGLAIANERMYAIGGFDGGLSQRIVEVYDPEANQWSLYSSMSDERSGAGVGVIRMP